MSLAHVGVERNISTVTVKISCFVVSTTAIPQKCGFIVGSELILC